MVEMCVHVDVNGKMRPAETVPGIGRGWGMKENGGGVNSSTVYLIYRKNLCTLSTA
jgi:hypothetical protein